MLGLQKVGKHTAMEGLVDHGYNGIDPTSKVRYLLDGIWTDIFGTAQNPFYV